MPIILFFMCFIFFKGMAVLLLEENMTVVGALLAAVCVTAVTIGLGLITNLSGLEWLAKIESREPHSPAPLKPIIALPVAVTASVLISYFVLIGFSPRLADRIDLVEDFGNFRPYRDDWLWFIVMISIPVCMHWGLQYRAILKMRDRLTDPR
ncbi:hypothetical protein SAMN04244548_02978 [Paracoccus pantotrophus]|nr:hypothetical protein SAMN04244548_02978 [Paracoccus pantotrophus]